MTKLTVANEPRVNTRFILGYARPVHLRIGDSGVLFSKGEPIAIQDHDVVYFPDWNPSGGRTRLINQFEPDMPHVRLAPAEFDFVVGAALTALGIQLARRQP